MGTPRQTQIAPLELPRYGGGRLSGIRCIATHLKPETPSEAALTAMAIQRLDALVWLTLTGGGFQRRGGGGDRLHPRNLSRSFDTPGRSAKF